MNDASPSGATAGGHRRAQGAAAPGRGERGHDHGQHDDGPRVAGEAGEARAEGSGEPVAARQGEEAGRRRGQEEALGVRHGQDVGRRAEHEEQHRPVGEPRAEHLPDGEPDRQGRGEAEDERGDERRVRQAQPRHLRQRPHGGREGREEGPAAPVALVDQLVRVPVLGDLQVPATVPQRPHGLHEAQPGVDGRGDQRGGEDGHARRDVVGRGTQQGPQAGRPDAGRRSVGAATRASRRGSRARDRRQGADGAGAVNQVGHGTGAGASTGWRGRGGRTEGPAPQERETGQRCDAAGDGRRQRVVRQGVARRGHRPRRSPPSWPPG